ncbi:hypothetical protein BT69DRAFT_1281426 [Atractiella rhizophila]|nr:hypothetical protein BT69DRAFT_1281426 [Atractiella rhizophila]
MGTETRLSGRKIADVAAKEEEEEKVLFAFREGKVRLRDFPTSKEGMMKTLCLDLPPSKKRGWVEREVRGLRRWFGFITPVVGAAFVAFGSYAYTHDVVVPVKVDESRLVLVGTVFTVAIGFWRTLALGGTRSAIREVRSEEWTRLSDRARNRGLMEQEKVKGVLEDVSTNMTSVIDSTRHSILFKPRSLISGYYRLAFVAFFIMSACSIISQGAIQLQLRPVPLESDKQHNVNSYSADVPTVYTALRGKPWANEQAVLSRDVIQISIEGLQTSSNIGSGYALLEKELGATIGLKMPAGDGEGYFLMQPQETFFEQNASLRFYTDLGTWKINCDWTVPMLQTWTPAVNATSFFSIELPDKNVKGIQSPPWGYPWFHPLQQPQRMDGEEDYIFTGLFAWTIFGSSSGSKVNLDSVPHADLSSDWQDWIRAALYPTYSAYIQEYLEVPTKLSTLVCEPNIKILHNSTATFFNGTASFDKRDNLGKKVGNLDFAQVAHVFYYLASNLALSELGSFQPYLPFGSLPGLIALSDAKLDGVNSTVPRKGADISKTFNKVMTSQMKIYAQTPWSNVSSFAAPVGERYTVDVSLPQLIATGAMFGVLSVIILVFEFRTKLRKFTLAGILLAGGTDLRGWSKE